MTMLNTLVCYDTAKVTAVKSFIVQAPVEWVVFSLSCCPTNIFFDRLFD